MHAAALDEQGLIRRVVLDRCLVSWTDVVRRGISRDQLASVVPGVLRYYDLPDLAARLDPLPVEIRSRRRCARAAGRTIGAVWNRRRDGDPGPDGSQGAQIMELDPQARDFLDRLAAAQMPPIQEQTVAQARAQMNLSTQFLGPLPRVARVEDRRIPGPGGEIRVRIITPQGAGPGPLPVLVYFHGGGWVLGNIESHEGVCRAVANAAGLIVATVDYRLAPEHRFPAAAEDAYAAAAWAAAHAGEFGGDPERIAVGGDSAGGNLAAVACLMARDRGGPRLAFQVLIYPITDYNLHNASYRQFAEGFFLTRSEMAWYWEHYVPKLDDRWHPHASPCQAGDLSGLPPALVITAGCDVLRDEGETYARQLQSAGVTVKVSRYDGMIHGFVRRYPFFDQGKAAIDEIARELRTALAIADSRLSEALCLTSGGMTGYHEGWRSRCDTRSYSTAQTRESASRSQAYRVAGPRGIPKRRRSRTSETPYASMWPPSKTRLGARMSAKSKSRYSSCQAYPGVNHGDAVRALEISRGPSIRWQSRQRPRNRDIVHEQAFCTAPRPCSTLPRRWVPGR